MLGRTLTVRTGYRIAIGLHGMRQIGYGASMFECPSCHSSLTKGDVMAARRDASDAASADPRELHCPRCATLLRVEMGNPKSLIVGLAMADAMIFVAAGTYLWATGFEDIPLVVGISVAASIAWAFWLIRGLARQTRLVDPARPAVTSPLS